MCICWHQIISTKPANPACIASKNIFIIHIAVINGTLSVVRHPTEDEESLEGLSLFEDNRTGILLGSQINLNCAAETSNNALATQILWIRDGNIITEDVTHHITTTNLNSSLEITNFAQSDAGVYQCIFNAETTELITTRPYGLQTGE